MSHREFIKSLQNRDGRKWELIEGPEREDGSSGIYVEVAPGQAELEAGEGPVARRNRKARQQMKKRVSKPGRSYAWRLGYNHCIGQYAPDEFPVLSGSSLNRKKAKPKEPELTVHYENVVHFFSPRSRGKVKDKATAFHRSAVGNRIFLTLTFIDDVSDKEGVQILNKFLTVLRREKKGLEYLWVAEHQEESRTTIHFHMILNRWLPIKRYNALWVLQQYNAGLVGKDQHGNVIPKAEIERRYQIDMESKSKKADGGIMDLLNPVDIEPCKSIHGLSYYLTKYITNQKKKDPFGCANWHCSRGVSKLFTKETVGPSTFAYMLSFNNYKVDKTTGECFRPAVLQNQFFTMVYVNNKAAPLSRLKMLEKVNKWMMKEQFDPDGVSMLNEVLYPKAMYNGY